MSATSVPSPKTFIDSFPNQLPKIDGLPDYNSLTEARSLLKANAATVPCNCGGGANGYLGIVVSAAVYATISNVAFALPHNPGPQPIIPAGATGDQIAELVRVHTELLREWQEYTNVHQALKKQLLNSIDPIYL